MSRKPPAMVWDPDRTWTEAQWQELVVQTIGSGLVNWREVATAMLAALNPPQVGTGIASRAAIKERYGKGTTMRAVMSWFYAQSGLCRSCGRRINIEVDHVVARIEIGDDAEDLKNLQLLCKRCNAIKRPSHKNAGKTFLTAEAALMWLLLTDRPKTYKAYEALCRRYGLTMASIRFQEAWAMAIWLSRFGMYDVEDAVPPLNEVAPVSVERGAEMEQADDASVANGLEADSAVGPQTR